MRRIYPFYFVLLANGQIASYLKKMLNISGKHFTVKTHETEHRHFAVLCN